MYHAPDYLGYVTTANGEPTLFFDTGFLVQADHDPTRCGWYSYAHRFQIAAHISEERARMLTSERLFNTTTAILQPFEPMALHAPNLPEGQDGQAALLAPVRTVPARLPAAQAGERLCLSDSDREDWRPGMPLYLFPGPLMQVGLPGFNPAFDENHALARVGPLDGSGRPTRTAVVALRNELVVFD